MKKIFGAAICLMVWFSSCTKQEMFKHSVDEYNYATEVVSNQKSGTLYNVGFLVGHPGTNCPGCVTINGVSTHVPCQGYGNACSTNAVLNVIPATATLYTGITQDSTDLTSEEFFNMPARSLYMGLDNAGAPHWLNIPAQLSIRDSVTRLFTFQGLYFSDQQIYKNQ